MVFLCCLRLNLGFLMYTSTAYYSLAVFEIIYAHSHRELVLQEGCGSHVRLPWCSHHNTNAAPKPTPAKAPNTISALTINGAAAAPLCEALTPVCCTLPGLPALGELEVELAELATLDAPLAPVLDVSVPLDDDDDALMVVTPVTVPDVKVLVVACCGTGAGNADKEEFEAVAELVRRVDGVLVWIADAVPVSTSTVVMILNFIVGYRGRKFVAMLVFQLSKRTGTR